MNNVFQHIAPFQNDHSYFHDMIQLFFHLYLIPLPDLCMVYTFFLTMLGQKMINELG